MFDTPYFWAFWFMFLILFPIFAYNVIEEYFLLYGVSVSSLTTIFFSLGILQEWGEFKHGQG